jgi:type I restriction enzyme R subunit
MTGIGEIERKTQNRVVALVKDALGYEYLGDLTEYDNENIIEAQLRKSLKDRGYSTVLVAIRQRTFTSAIAMFMTCCVMEQK